jgi:hypothetical protein
VTLAEVTPPDLAPLRIALNATAADALLYMTPPHTAAILTFVREEMNRIVALYGTPIRPWSTHTPFLSVSLSRSRPHAHPPRMGGQRTKAPGALELGEAADGARIAACRPWSIPLSVTQLWALSHRGACVSHARVQRRATPSSGRVAAVCPCWATRWGALLRSICLPATTRLPLLLLPPPLPPLLPLLLLSLLLLLLLLR